MFELGQKIVCVKNHSQGAVKEGEIYTVKDLMLCAKCKSLAIDVGIKAAYGKSICGSCNVVVKIDRIHWINHILFRPLDDLYNEELNEELSEIFTKEPFEL
jgi:hypothetical protein